MVLRHRVLASGPPGERHDVRAFVTGATGVVGGSLAEYLVAEGDAVTCFGRRPAALADVTSVEGSLLSHRQLAAAMEDHDVVYHVAGVNQLCPTDVETMYEINVDAARTVARAAATAGVPKLVYTSSVAAASAKPPSHYARSKALGERAVLAESGTEVIAVRPASVQGPGRASGSTAIIIDIVSGRLPFAVDTTVSVVDIDDCSVGHRAAARHGDPGAVYTLAGFTVSIRQALEMVGAILGRDLEVRFIPVEALALAAPFVGLSRLWRSEPLLCPELVRTLREDHRHDGSTAAARLGFEYRAAEDSIGRLLDWLVRTERIS